MNQKEYINPDGIRQAISILQEPGAVFEVRAIGTKGKKDILSGYFRDADSLLAAMKNVDFRNRNFYITLGRVKDECFARAQSNKFLISPQTTSDTEVTAYRWLFVDLDPVRTAGISSTQEELQAAYHLADKVEAYLEGMGFQMPVDAMSGNGVHLLYRIDVKTDKAGQKLVAKCLKVLSMMFDTDRVTVDTTNFNPSRICKLHGTLAQKGTSTADRPHRMSRVEFVPEEIKITSTEVLQKLAAELPDEPEPAYRNRTATSATNDFDLLSFMSMNGMTYKEGSNDQAKIYSLDACPFDSNHRDGDAKIFQYRNGAIAFKCHHNSCRDRKWQDVRLLFEPDAYDKEYKDTSYIDDGYQKHKKQAEAEQAEPDYNPDPEQEPEKKSFRKLQKYSDLLKEDIPEPVVYVGAR